MTRRIALLLLTLTLLVVVPFLLWESWFVELSDWLLSSSSARWVTLLVIALFLGLDILLPVPSSLISVAGGAYLGLTLGTIASVIGMSLGCVLGHFLGFWLHKDKIRRIVSVEDQTRLDKFFRVYGAWTLTIARPIPVFAEVSVVVAGLSGMRLRKLLLYTVPANLGIALAYSAIGHFSMRVDSFLLAFAGAVTVPIVAYCLFRIVRVIWPGWAFGQAER